MLLRSLPVLVASLSLVGCAASSPDAEAEVSSTSESGLTSISSVLRAQTALDRTRTIDTASGSVSVEYAPSPYDGAVGDERRLAFEAVAFRASAEAEVAVAGDFPSSATVIVTNERFEPLAISRTVRTSPESLAEATIRIPAGEGQRLVLVRDPQWVRPMTFEVSVTGR